MDLKVSISRQKIFREVNMGFKYATIHETKFNTIPIGGKGRALRWEKWYECYKIKNNR
jgi:hypothetical protein